MGHRDFVSQLLFLAFFKVRLVLNYFMEVRHAPVELRWSCEAWVLISWLGITAASIGALA